MYKRNWRNDDITAKQLNYIKILEYRYNTKFTGSTKGEASDFISKYVEIEEDEYWREEAIFDSFWGGMDQY